MLIDPIVKTFDVRFAEMTNALTNALGEMKAMMRTIQDPETGYVPQAHLKFVEERLQAEINSITLRLDKDEASRPQVSSNRALWAGVIIAAISGIGSFAVAAFHH